MAKGDDRAVVGSSGRPLPGMILESGTATVAKVLGRLTTHPTGDRLTGRGAQFDVEGMQDHSMGSEPGKL